MYNQKYITRHRKGSLSQVNGTSSEKTFVKSQRAFSNEERAKTHLFYEKSQELSCIEQEKLDLQMIKKELLQFQHDIQQKNQIKKKRNIREFKDKVEVFMHAVRFLIIKQSKNQSSSSNIIKTYDELGNDNDRTFPQENSIFQQNEETSLLVKDQEKKSQFTHSVNKDLSKYSEQAEEQLSELQELLQILNECINELSAILEQKALMHEDELSLKTRDMEYTKEIENLEHRIKQLQNSKVKQELELMKDGFIFTDKNILNLFDLDFVINLMDKKKSEDAIQAVIVIQSFFIQEIEQLLEEKQKGCFSVYDCLLNIYDASNKHLIKVFNENPILEFQQKLFLERQQKLNKIIKEKQQFITQSQENVFSNFPQLRDFVENFKNNSSNLCMLVLENQNNLDISVLFKMLQSSFKYKLESGMYTQVLTNVNNLPQLQVNIEKYNQKINSLEDRALLLKSKLNIYQQQQESLINNDTKLNSSSQSQTKAKNDILDDIKLVINDRKNSLLSQKKKNLFDLSNQNQESYQSESCRKNHFKSANNFERSLNQSRSTSNHNNMSKDKSPVSHNNSLFQTYFESTQDYNGFENKQEYLFEKIKTQCLQIGEQIKYLDILRERNILTFEETIQKDIKRVDQKEKFLASSIYRTLKLIKFKFEMIHNHQQSSYFSINSYGQSKLNTEERDRVIFQLFGEANLLCQDYENYFNKQYSCLKSEKSDFRSTLFSSINSQNSKSKFNRSLSASKVSLNSYNNLDNSYLLKQTSKAKEQKPINNQPSLPKINSHQNIHNNQLESKSSTPKQYSNLIENKVQKIIQQYSSPTKNSFQNSLNQTQNIQELEQLNSFSFYPHRQNSLSLHKKQYSADSSITSIQPNYIFQHSNQQIQNESQLNKKCQDLNTESATVVYCTPCSQYSNLQSSNCSNVTIYQNVSFNTSQNQTSLNEIHRINTSQDQKYCNLKTNYSCNKNTNQKNNTINISQFLNNKSDFSQNSSIRKIKNILKSPDSSSNKLNTNLSSQNSQYQYQNQSQKNTSIEYKIQKKSQKSQSPEIIKRNLIDQFEQERSRNKTMYEQNNKKQPNQNQFQQNYYFYQAPTSQRDQNQNQLQQFQQNDQKSKTGNNKSDLFSKSKFGVVRIQINDQELQVKENSNVLSNTQSCSTIEQEQQNFNLTKINSTFNKTQDQLYLIGRDDFAKFSFSNIENVSNNTNQSKSLIQKREPLTTNKNTLNEQTKNYSMLSREQYYPINQSQEQSQSTIDKENFYVQRVNQSKDTKQMSKNATHRKLNSLLQAANTQEYTQNNAGSSKKLTIPYSNQSRAVASKSPQCKSPLSKETSIYEGSNENNSQFLDSIQQNYQSVNKIVSARSNTSQLVSPHRDFSKQKSLSNPQDLLIGIPVYVRFNNQIILKKKIFDPTSMSIKDAMNLGYLYRIMKLNKQENKIEFFKERGNQKLTHINNNFSCFQQIQSPQYSNKFVGLEANNDKYTPQFTIESKLQLDKCIPIQQIKKISIPQKTQNLQKLQNASSQNIRSPFIDEKKLEIQNNYLLCIDSKDCGQIEFIVNSLQTYQVTYNSLCSVMPI
ncbi:hypothetical protein ABPG73_000988 [Tetrahymena malaccensis]